MRDPDLLVYYREDGDGIVMGGYERDSRAVVARRRGSSTGSRRTSTAACSRRSGSASRRSPRTPPPRPGDGDAQVTRLINGPEAFTPDNEFCLGATEVRGLFVAAGFCAHGLAGAGGIGKVMAEWIQSGEPQMDVWQMDVRRFGRAVPLAAATRSRGTKEDYETYYDIKYPGQERQAGRPLRVSSAYGGTREHGAAFGEKSGWERVNWYEPNAAAGDEALRPARLGGPALVAGDRRRAPRQRERAGLFDESSFAKLEISGAGAAEFLERMCATTSHGTSAR